MLRVVMIVLLVLACGSTQADTFVCIEAESSTNIVPRMVIGGASLATTNAGWSAVKGASGDTYIDLPQAEITNTTQEAGTKTAERIPGSVSYRVHASDSGSHQLWCRVWWLDSCGNSLSISIDGERPFSFGQDRTYKKWHWVKAPKRLKQLNLSKGSHLLTITAREDGVRIDQILLTDDEDYVPVGIEDTTKP